MLLSVIFKKLKMKWMEKEGAVDKWEERHTMGGVGLDEWEEQGTVRGIG